MQNANLESSNAARGDERGESPPPSDQGDPFLVRNMKYRNLSQPNFIENEQLTCFGGAKLGLQGSNVKPQGAHPRLNRTREGLLQSTLGKQMPSFHFRRRGPVDQGGLSMASFTLPLEL